MNRIVILLSLLYGFSARGEVRGISIVDSGQKCSIRGMSIPSDSVLWVSGSNGHIARSVDRGKTFQWTAVTGSEKTDFRDIHAFNRDTALIMGIGNPAYILKTTNGGQTWKVVYRKDTAGMFLDAMDFRDAQHGICIGDPIATSDGRLAFFLIRTRDGGETWYEEPEQNRPTAGVGEAVFSASGTNIHWLKNKRYDYAFISGGAVSNLYLVRQQAQRYLSIPIPIAKGSESSGAFSMAAGADGQFYCVGGDYKQPSATGGVFSWTSNWGKSWRSDYKAAPGGYRSCIRLIGGGRMIACGTNGVDICDSPDRWKNVSHEGFNVCLPTPDKKRVFFGGSNGKIGFLKL